MDKLGLVQCSLDGFHKLSLNFGGKWKKLAESGHQGHQLLECMLTRVTTAKSVLILSKGGIQKNKTGKIASKKYKGGGWGSAMPKRHNCSHKKWFYQELYRTILGQCLIRIRLDWKCSHVQINSKRSLLLQFRNIIIIIITHLVSVVSLSVVVACGDGRLDRLTKDVDHLPASNHLPKLLHASRWGEAEGSCCSLREFGAV